MPNEKWIWLDDAISEFATKADIDFLQDKFQYDTTEVEQLKPRAQNLKELSPVEIAAAFSNLLQAVVSPLLVRTELFRLLCEKIVSGKLTAKGVQTKPSVSSEKIIDAAFFKDPNPTGKNTIENAGHRFELIKVCRSSALRNSVKIQHQSVGPKRRTSGRKSHEDKIRPVVSQLIRDGKIKSNRFQQKSAELVISTLGYDPENPPAGFAYSTIKKIISSEFDSMN